ncbi:class I SAM-dependent methyltransferase [Saccharibacillus alkalitolerans]|uniref:SAM-dependent methyltransferase n=1 Tax=Saccharibacillus alkalitolerans TaxID=2705290 RepID=A0ABX0FAC6_9BACL|nr:SAM-dependent methyltransferase [Saccharibacillus alkalitolerans]NGZ77887.1 SAM-dependent methyltransferase [Saccharibacillus alkalitolerans]
MQNIDELLEAVLPEGRLVTATVSQPRRKDGEAYAKVAVKPVLLKNELHYQLAYHYEKKVTHDNLTLEEARKRIAELLENDMRQGLFCTLEADYQVLVSKKGKTAILKKPPTKKEAPNLAHNRKKTYVLDEGEPVPFLVELGVMNDKGRVLAAKYDKFRQINRFLEMVRDILPALPKERKLTIVDFGCGKSYLTFALYHYLAVQEGFELNVVGLDLKADVIEHCESLARTLNYVGLHFRIGDIADYDEFEAVDMVITLHACDTATDAALEKAVRWGASAILSVPCCQHELFSQVQNDVLEPLLSHGILKERFSALATDAIRAKLLDIVGYKTQLLEFIDMEHTPKNILIRAVKSGGQDTAALWREYEAFRGFLGASPYLENALRDRLPAASNV